MVCGPYYQIFDMNCCFHIMKCGTTTIPLLMTKPLLLLQLALREHSIVL